MESTNDLFRIATWNECAQDRWFAYDHEEWTLCGSMNEYRRRTYNKYIDKSHYDNIPRLRQLVSDLDRQISQYSKGAAAAVRIKPLHAKRKRLEQQIHELEVRWTRIKNEMTKYSQKMLILPKEIRERIFGYLYTRRSELEISFPDPDVRYSMLPRDPYLYLNADVVHPAIAVEAAQVLYDTNRFNVVAWNTDCIARFIRTDHFNSGIAPKDVIRIFRMTMRSNIEYSLHDESHSDFEHQRRGPRPYVPRGSDREKLAVLLEMRQLQRVHLSLDLFWCTMPFEYREISPIIKILREQGVTIDVNANKMLADQMTEIYDLSAIFDPPTLQQKVNAKINDDSGTLRESIDRVKPKLKRHMRRLWFSIDLSCFEVGTVAQWCVYLDEHYQTFQSIEIEEKTKMLKNARNRLDAVVAGLAFQGKNLIK